MCLCRERDLFVEQRAINIYDNYSPLRSNTPRSRDNWCKATMNLMAGDIGHRETGNTKPLQETCWGKPVSRIPAMSGLEGPQRCSGLIYLPSIDSTCSGHNTLMVPGKPSLPTCRGRQRPRSSQLVRSSPLPHSDWLIMSP